MLFFYLILGGDCEPSTLLSSLEADELEQDGDYVNKFPFKAKETAQILEILKNSRDNSSFVGKEFQDLPEKTHNNSSVIEEYVNNRYSAIIDENVRDGMNETDVKGAVVHSSDDKRGSENEVKKSGNSKYQVNDDIISPIHLNRSIKEKKLKPISDWKRATTHLDTYAESLLHVNRIYNLAYGFERRKVPAHMPHLLNKWVIYEMQSKFKDEFERTSSHKFRNSKDMQFAFSYFYFLASEKQKISVGQIFDEFDSDKSG